MPWLSQIVVGLRPVFNLRPVHVGFMIEVAHGQDFLQVFLFSLARIIQQVLHIHIQITDTI